MRLMGAPDSPRFESGTRSSPFGARARACFSRFSNLLARGSKARQDLGSRRGAGDPRRVTRQEHGLRPPGLAQRAEGEQREADAGVSASTARRAERGAPVRFRTGRKVAGIPGPRAISRSGPPADARVVGRRETAGPGYPCRVSRSATKGGRNELHPHRHAPFSSVGVAGTRRSARTFHAL
jgi:hypothetical protein